MKWIVGPHPWDRLLVDDARLLADVHRDESDPPRYEWTVLGETGQHDESCVAAGTSPDLAIAQRAAEAVVALHPGCGVREDEP